MSDIMDNDSVGVRQLYISAKDECRLRELLHVAAAFDASNAAFLRELEMELDRACILPPEEIPPYVVTMNTRFRLVDLDSGLDQILTLVFPADADAKQGKLSVLSDIGVSVIGFSSGDTVPIPFTKGRCHCRIDTIYFQPEATKQYDL